MAFGAIILLYVSEDSIGGLSPDYDSRMHRYRHFAIAAAGSDRPPCRFSSCRVLRPNGSAISGLFGAGGTAAGISGTGPEHYMSGNGLIQALATGMIAGEVMAAATKAATSAP